MSLPRCGTCEHRYEHPRSEFAVENITDFYCLHPAQAELPLAKRWLGFLDVVPEWCPLKPELKKLEEA